ncbi:MAG: YcxB family protein [Mobilitalea sp.]
MDIVFENCYTMTKERFLNWAKHPIKKNYFIVLWVVFMILAFIMFFISIINDDIIFSFYYLMFLMFFIYRIFFRIKIIASRAFHIISCNQGSKEWLRVIQFTDCILVIDGNSTTQYQWNQIDKLIDEKEYLILLFKNKRGIRLTKNGFTKGTVELFLQFIKNENIPITNRI